MCYCIIRNMVELNVPNKLSVITEHLDDYLSFADKLTSVSTGEVAITFPTKFWTYPAGLVLLAQYASKIRKAKGNLLCKNTPKYITTSKNGQLSSILNLKTLKQRYQTETTSEEIVQFISAHGDIGKYVDKNLIQDNLDEMMLNAFDHSGESEVSVFGQSYSTKQEVIFTVLDLGIGIPEHIRRKYPPSLKPENALFADDAYCIQQATHEGFTGSTPDKNSGVGLYYLKQFIENTRSNLRIISGNGYYECIGGKERTSKNTIPFRGTIVDFQLLLSKVPDNQTPALVSDDFPF